MKGALDVVLRHCSSLASGTELVEEHWSVFRAKASEFGHRGLRGGHCCCTVLELLRRGLC